MQTPRIQRLVLIALASVILCTQGCVMSSTHEALQKQYDTAKADLADRDRKITDMDAEIARLESEIKSLSEAKAKLQGDLSAILSDKDRLEGSVAEMQQALQELERRKAEAEARVAEYRQFVAKFQKLIDEGKLKIKIRDGRMVVELATDILFESGKAELSDPGVLAIKEVSAVLATIGEKKFQVGGPHRQSCQSLAISSFPSNWELAAARSITVVKTMVEGGMPPARVSGASYGESTPAADNATDQGRASNRRIEIVVVPDLSTLPGFNELQNMGK